MTCLMPKDGDCCYCASCKKPIDVGDLVVFSSTKSGTMKIHHLKCPKDFPPVRKRTTEKERSKLKFWS